MILLWETDFRILTQLLDFPAKMQSETSAVGISLERCIWWGDRGWAGGGWAIGSDRAVGDVHLNFLGGCVRVGGVGATDGAGRRPEMEGPSSNKHQKGPGSNPQDLDWTRLISTSSDTSNSAKVVTVFDG